jgi:hypothetical protein
MERDFSGQKEGERAEGPTPKTRVGKWGRHRKAPTLEVGIGSVPKRRLLL